MAISSGNVRFFVKRIAGSRCINDNPAPPFRRRNFPNEIHCAQRRPVSRIAPKGPANLRVAIRADKRAPFGEIIRVIDAAKLAQVASIDAYTEKAE